MTGRITDPWPKGLTEKQKANYARSSRRWAHFGAQGALRSAELGVQRVMELDSVDAATKKHAGMVLQEIQRLQELMLHRIDC